MTHESYLMFWVLLLYGLGVIESFIYLTVCIMNTTPQKRPLFFFFFFFLFNLYSNLFFFYFGGLRPLLMRWKYQPNDLKKQENWIVWRQKIIRTNFGSVLINFSFWYGKELRTKLNLDLRLTHIVSWFEFYTS